MRIPRHPIDLTEARERYDRTAARIPMFLRGASANPSTLTLLASNAFDVAAGASIFDPEGPELIRAFELGGQALTALFAAASLTDEPVEVPLGETTVRYERRPDTSIVHASRWVQAFAVAAACRSAEMLDTLCATPTDLLRASSTRAPDYVFETVDACKAFRARDPAASKRILRAMEATDPNKYEFYNPDWVLELGVPFLELLFYVHLRDPDFEAGLIKALQLHNKYWTRDPEKMRDWNGYLAFGPLGMAALADLRDMPFDVESEYMPASLVRGTHLG